MEKATFIIICLNSISFQPSQQNVCSYLKVNFHTFAFCALTLSSAYTYFHTMASVDPNSPAPLRYHVTHHLSYPEVRGGRDGNIAKYVRQTCNGNEP